MHDIVHFGHLTLMILHFPLRRKRPHARLRCFLYLSILSLSFITNMRYRNRHKVLNLTIRLSYPFQYNHFDISIPSFMILCISCSLWMIRNFQAQPDQSQYWWVFNITPKLKLKAISILHLFMYQRCYLLIVWKSIIQYAIVPGPYNMNNIYQYRIFYPCKPIHFHSVPCFLYLNKERMKGSICVQPTYLYMKGLRQLIFSLHVWHI